MVLLVQQLLAHRDLPVSHGHAVGEDAEGGDAAGRDDHGGLGHKGDDERRHDDDPNADEIFVSLFIKKFLGSLFVKLGWSPVPQTKARSSNSPLHQGQRNHGPLVIGVPATFLVPALRNGVATFLRGRSVPTISLYKSKADCH